jgi:hypothetical protein
MSGIREISLPITTAAVVNPTKTANLPPLDHIIGVSSYEDRQLVQNFIKEIPFHASSSPDGGGIHSQLYKGRVYCHRATEDGQHRFATVIPTATGLYSQSMLFAVTLDDEPPVRITTTTTSISSSSSNQNDRVAAIEMDLIIFAEPLLSPDLKPLCVFTRVYDDQMCCSFIRSEDGSIFATVTRKATHVDAALIITVQQKTITQFQSLCAAAKWEELRANMKVTRELDEKARGLELESQYARLMELMDKTDEIAMAFENTK